MPATVPTPPTGFELIAGTTENVIKSPTVLLLLLVTYKVRPDDNNVYLIGLLRSPEVLYQVMPPSVLTCILVTFLGLLVSTAVTFAVKVALVVPV